MPPTVRPKADRRRQSAPPPTAPDMANDSPRVSESDIALRAFAYYCERGGQDGSALEDWLRAERELLAPPKPARRRKAASA